MFVLMLIGLYTSKPISLLAQKLNTAQINNYLPQCFKCGMFEKSNITLLNNNTVIGLGYMIIISQNCIIIIYSYL